MAEIPIITHVIGREPAMNPDYPVLIALHCETDSGRILLRLTGEAAHELKGHLDNLPPKIGKRADLHKLGGDET